MDYVQVSEHRNGDEIKVEGSRHVQRDRCLVNGAREYFSGYHEEHDNKLWESVAYMSERGLYFVLCILCSYRQSVKKVLNWN